MTMAIPKVPTTSSDLPPNNLPPATDNLPPDIDPRLTPEFIESQLCAHAKGINRRIKKLMTRKHELITELRDLHTTVKKLQIQSIETQKALFEKRKLIKKVSPKRTTLKNLNPKEPREQDILRTLDTMSDHQKAVLMTKLMDAGIINK